MVFSTNQARQIYVAKAVKNSAANLTTLGDILVEGPDGGTYFYFVHKGAGGNVRSDLIDIANITYAKATDADTMAYPLAKYKITLDSNVNNGAPVSGQDYLIKIAIKNFVSLNEESMYFKYGMAHATANMSASTLYKTLALSLVKNFSREYTTYFKFYLETDGEEADEEGTLVEVTSATKESSLNGAYTGLVIEEAPQEWTLGVKPQETVNFEITPDFITIQGEEVAWGAIHKIASTNKIPNGHLAADMEYFYMGERADVYRGINWPNNVPTTYLVDPSVKYNTIDIHYSYIGSGIDSVKSEKDITILVPKVGATNAVSNVLTNSLITAINNQTGLSIVALSVA